MIDERVATSLAKLELWIAGNGWAGYDPYDLRDTTLFRFLGQFRLGRLAANGVFMFAPMLARQVLRVRPQINAKAIGLLARGSLARFEATQRDHYLQQATDCLQWLDDNSCRGYSGACWGYPFNWHSRVEIPAGTPSGVVSSVVGSAFLEAYKQLKEPRYLATASSIADFFLQDLNLDRPDDKRACFSYTPIDRFHVHNANLLIAAHLYQVGQLTGRDDCLAAAEPAVAYTLAEQNDDGSWYYWGPPDRMPFRVDHYHTGFILRALDHICQIADRPEWETALSRGFDFYLNRLFDPSGLPKLTPENPYPVDIHSCAEAILCLGQLQARFPRAPAGLARTIKWTLDTMQALDGHFFYRKYPKHMIRIAFLRWGQAWMYFALSAYGKATSCPLNWVESPRSEPCFRNKPGHLTALEQAYRLWVL